jgi:hypothetical protein
VKIFQSRTGAFRAERFSSEPIPSGRATVRNMGATPDGRLYLACSGVNKVSIMDAIKGNPPGPILQPVTEEHAWIYFTTESTF